MIGLLSGCATAPPPPIAPEVVATLDYGPRPDNYQELIKRYFAQTLHDPASARFRFGEPYTGYLQQGLLLGGRVQQAGYFVDVWVQAKMPSGEYTPEKHLVVLIKNGEVLMELTEQDAQRIKR